MTATTEKLHSSPNYHICC